MATESESAGGCTEMSVFEVLQAKVASELSSPRVGGDKVAVRKGRKFLTKPIVGGYGADWFSIEDTFLQT